MNDESNLLPTAAANPANTFLGVADLRARWGCGRTYAYNTVKAPGFPRPVVAYRWRLDHILAWEADVASGAAPAPAPPAGEGVSGDDSDLLAPRPSRKRAAA